jgi:hypothetical protein
VPRGEKETGERERGGPEHGGRQRGAKDVAGKAPGHRVWAAALLCEQGRATGHKRRDAARLRGGWGRAATGSSGQWRDAGGREKGEVAWWRGANRQARLAQCRAVWFKLGFKPIQNIQTVQMKFEFLQIWLVQKIPSHAPKF